MYGFSVKVNEMEGRHLHQANWLLTAEALTHSSRSLAEIVQDALAFK